MTTRELMLFTSEELQRENLFGPKKLSESDINTIIDCVRDSLLNGGYVCIDIKGDGYADTFITYEGLIY